MTRKKLIGAVRDTALEMNYCFYSEFDHRIGETIIAYPAIWLSPPRITAVDGENEGRIKYRLSIQLMRLGANASQQERENLLCNLERDALDLARRLALNGGIDSVRIAECSPAEFSVTNHGEISVNLKADVEIHFCNC